MANGDLATLKGSYEAAKKDFDFWTTGNKCEPGSVKWEESVSKHNAAKDAYDFALSEAGTRPSPRKNRSVAALRQRRFLAGCTMNTA